MNRILNPKNLTKKIAIFFLLFFISVSSFLVNNLNKAKADVYIRNNLIGSDHILATSSNSDIDNAKINKDVLEGDTSFKYLFLKGSSGYLSALKKNYVDAITTKYNTAIDSIKSDANKDQEKTDLDAIKNNVIKLVSNSEIFLDTTYNYVFNTLRNDSSHGYVMAYGGTNQVNAVTNKARRLYMYYYFNDQILLIAIKYKDSANSSMKDIYTYTTDKIDTLKNGATGNLYAEEEALTDEEINGSYIKTHTWDVTKGVFIGEKDNTIKINVIGSGDIFKLPITTDRQKNNGTDPLIIPDNPEVGRGVIASAVKDCRKDVNFGDFLNPISSDTPIIGGRDQVLDCSLGAYLINTIIQGINSLVNIVVSLAGALFDWIYQVGVIGFKDWVNNSGAYTIYKTIILSLIISVMTFFVFYLIIRRLIDDDGEKMNKILPKLILTALFVYFSFTITGWIIDQSNIITIYLYRSMTHQVEPAQTIGEVFKNILNLEGGVSTKNTSLVNDNFGVSIGLWEAIPFTVGQLVVSIVGMFVLFQGAILLLSRTIILLLCMIFSPLMLLPEGLTEFTDKYKKLVTDNFTGNVLLGPVFMFLVFLAIEIGDKATQMIGSTGPAATTGEPVGFLAGIISSVLVIVVLQLAISASKSLSGSMGEKLGGVIGKYAGGAAFGGGAKILRNTLGRGAAAAKDKGWMMGKPGSGRHKFMSTLYNGMSKNTFDARNTDTFKSAANLSGAGANSFGQGSNKNYNDSFKAKLYNANKYHNELDEGGKQRNISRLKNLGSAGDIDSKRIADSLEKKWKPSINERLNNDSDYNKKFDKAHGEKDEEKRKIETEKVINEHFKENGRGADHFSKEITRPENKNIKQEYDKALGEKDPIKRKESLTKVIADLDKKTNPDEGSLAKSLEPTRIQNVNSNSGPKPSETNHENINSLRSRLQEKYSKQDVDEYKQKRMNLYQDKSLKEAKEKQDTEIAAEKEKNGGYIPSGKDIDAQNSLKDKLKEKFSTRERMENGKIVTEISPELLDQRKKDLETTRRNIERKRENEYQQSVLNKALSGKDDDSNDNGPSTPSPSGSQRPEISSSVSVNESGKLRPMYSQEELATLNQNRKNSGEDDKKVA